MDQSLFSAPHDLSQSITSFIASYCQGIHQTPFSRLIWSRKSKVLWYSPLLAMLKPFCKPQTIRKPKPHGNRLVSPFPSIPGQKSYFSRVWCRIASLHKGLMSVEPHAQSSKKHILSNIAVARVSVLDLDNSVRFSMQTKRRARKHSSDGSHQPEGISTVLRSSPHSARSNSVVCYFKITLKVTVSL